MPKLRLLIVKRMISWREDRRNHSQGRIYTARYYALRRGLVRDGRRLLSSGRRLAALRIGRGSSNELGGFPANSSGTAANGPNQSGYVLWECSAQLEIRYYESNIFCSLADTTVSECSVQFDIPMDDSKHYEGKTVPDQPPKSRRNIEADQVNQRDVLLAEVGPLTRRPCSQIPQAGLTLLDGNVQEISVLCWREIANNAAIALLQEGNFPERRDQSRPATFCLTATSIVPNTPSP